MMFPHLTPLIPTKSPLNPHLANPLTSPTPTPLSIGVWGWGGEKGG